MRTALFLAVAAPLAGAASVTAAQAEALTPTTAQAAATFDTIFPTSDSNPRPARFQPTQRLWEHFVNNHLDTLRNATAGTPMTMCDVGAADGSLTAYIANGIGMRSVAYDITTPDNNIYSQVPGSAEIGATQTPVQLFDGRNIPQTSGTCTLTLFAYVLHHAAASTFKLLTEAIRVTPPTGYVLIAEDLASPTDAERSARNLMHDPHGVFRSDAEWVALFDTLGLEVLERGPLFGDNAAQGEAPQQFYLTQPRASAHEIQVAQHAVQERVAKQ